MTDVRKLMQTALDTFLYPDVHSYWLRKSGEDSDEYVVYTLGGDPAGAYADGVPLTRNANITVRYYYRDSMINDSAGRATIKGHEEQIATAITGAGFTLPNGYFDAGDIDDIGFGTTIFEANYSRVV